MSNTISREHDEALARYARVQSLYWLDEEFRNKMNDDPQGALAPYGVGSAPGVQLHLVVNDNNTVYLILPERPASITNEQVEVLSAAGTFGTGGSIGTAGTSCGTVGTFGTVFTFGCSSL
jgi:hypothetical protein